MPQINTYPTSSAQVGAAAEMIAQAARESIAGAGRFSIALAGGSTPRPVYEALAQDRQIDWSKVWIFWGDERCVPPDHAESNYRMAHEALLKHVPIPPGQIFRIEGEKEPHTAAAAYETALRDFLGTRQLDLILLGMGDDGHTASLFPGTAAIHEAERWVVAHEVEKLKAVRITMTPPLLNSARRVIFVVSGASKADRLKQVIEGPYQPDVLPSQVIHPESGEVFWLVDAAAAAQLRGA